MKFKKSVWPIPISKKITGKNIWVHFSQKANYLRIERTKKQTNQKTHNKVKAYWANGQMK